VRKVLSKRSPEIDWSSAWKKTVSLRMELMLLGPGLFHLEIPGREAAVNGRFLSVSPVLLTGRSQNGLTPDFKCVY